MKKEKKEYQFTNTDDAISYINRYRKIHLFLCIVYIILASISGAGGFAIIIVGMIAFDNYLRFVFLGVGSFSFLILCTFFILASIKIPAKFRETFYRLFSLASSKNKYQGFHFVDKKRRDYLFSHMAIPLSKSPDEDKYSFYEGKLEDTNFYSFLYMRIQKTQNVFTHAPTVDVAGRYLEFQVNTSYKTDIIIQNKHSLGYFKKIKLKDTFTTESVAFNDNYVIKTNDIYQAQLIITPTIINGINFLNDLYQGYCSACFKGNKVIVYFDKYQTGLKLTLSKRVDYQTLEDFSYEIQIPYQVYKALNLK